MNKFLLSVCLIALSLSGHAQKIVLNAADEGCTGDGITMNTRQIQAAIDRCNDNPEGGTLIFPKGIYRTGTIWIKSNVELHLEKGAVIKGTSNPWDYDEFEKYFKLYKKSFRPRLALIRGAKAENVTITGKGCIDGNGRKLAIHIDSLLHVRTDKSPYDHNRPQESLRPQLFNISECTRLTISSLNLRNSACWGLLLNKCEEVRLEHLHFINRAYWNNDGFDISDCKHVYVNDCFIDSADDAFCLKSHDRSSCNEDIVIENCTAISSASTVKFGTASVGGFKDIIIRNMKVKDTFRSAIAVESVDGAIIDNVLIENIQAENTGNALFIRLGHRSGETPGIIRNVTIRNLTAEIPFGTQTPDLAYDMRGPEIGGFYNPFPAPISGIPGHAIENVTLENIRIVYPGRSSNGIAYTPVSGWKKVPELESAYPEYSMFSELPSWGFFIRHVKGLKMKDIELRTREHDFRPAMFFEDAIDVKKENITVKNAKSRKRFVHLLAD